MIKIPLQKTPAQSFKIKLNGQNCEMRVYYRFGSTYLDLTVGGVVVVTGAICRDRQNIVQIAQNDFQGALFFVDMLGQSDPLYTDFGARWRLFYMTADEYAARQPMELPTDTKTIMFSPFQEPLLTYNGTEQTPTWKNFDSSQLSIDGDLAETNAGVYEAYFTPINGYKWGDGSVSTKTITWSINKVYVTIPVQSGAITYDGTAQTATFDHYDPLLMTISGDMTETNAGTYTATATLSDSTNYQWADGSQTSVNIPWTISRATIASVPVQSGTLTYDGTAQSPSWTGYDATKMTMTGTMSGTDAGIYYADCTPTSNYKWSDESVTAKSVSWNITPKAVTVPTVTGTSKTYNGSAQSPTISAYDVAEIVVGGVTSAIDAGAYNITFTLATSNYQWSDNTIEPKTVAWAIAKAAGSLSLSSNTLSLDANDPTGTVTVTRLGDGAIYVDTNDDTVATATVSGTTITVAGVDTGSATITVIVTEGTNYLSTFATIAVTVAFAPPISNILNDNSWADISTIAQAGEGDLYWDVGDCKEITLNGKVGDYLTLSNKKMCVFILDFNHKMNGSDENNIIFGCFKSALTSGVDVAMTDSRYYGDTSQTYTDGSKCFTMNHAGNKNYGGWKGSDLRYDILGATSTQPSEYNQLKTTANVGYDATAATLTSPKADTFLAALPSDLRAKLRLWTRWVDAVGNSSNVDANIKATVDAVTLLAEPEIFASRTYANQYEQNHNTRMAYYTAGNSTIKKKHSDNSTAVHWWECSPGYGDAATFCIVATGGVAARANAYYALGVAPAFKV